MNYFEDCTVQPPKSVSRLEICNGTHGSVFLERCASDLVDNIICAKGVIECGIAFFALKRLYGTLFVTFRAVDSETCWSATFTIEGKSNLLNVSFCVNDTLVSQRSFVTPMNAIRALRNYTATVCEQFLAEN